MAVVNKGFVPPLLLSSTLPLFLAVWLLVVGRMTMMVHAKPRDMAASSSSSSSIPLTRIRSIDGSVEDERGQAGAVLLRLSNQHAYPDGDAGMIMVDGPNPRKISNIVSNMNNIMAMLLLSEKTTTTSPASDMLWLWGQFIDHDMDLTEGGRDDQEELITIVSPDCDTDILCTIPFSRSEYRMVEVDDGSGGTSLRREQVNGITSFLDGSMVYGHTKERADALREFQGGRLKIQTVMDDNSIPLPHDMLPYNTPLLPNAALSNTEDLSKLFLAGDVRANEQLGLTSMHTLFVREHNRLVQMLATSYPGATDEELYQMGRKLVGAEIQQITYEEFLPMLLGKHNYEKSKILSSSKDKYAYDPSINPAIATEFSTVAFRVGHTMVSPSFPLITSMTPPGGGATGSDSNPETISLVDAFFNPSALVDTPEMMDYLLTGFCHQEAQIIDTKVVDELRSFLFGHPIAKTGLDLVSLNIQRGRDHGIPKYNALRVALGLQPKTSFADITQNELLQQALKDAYDDDIEMIDAWVGGLAEDHDNNNNDNGAMVGELFATIITDQFERLKLGDPFFYLYDADLKDSKLKKEILDVTTIRLSDILEANTGMHGFHSESTKKKNNKDFPISVMESPNAYDAANSNNIFNNNPGKAKKNNGRTRKLRTVRGGSK